jgi:hypothetical protein
MLRSATPGGAKPRNVVPRERNSKSYARDVADDPMLEAIVDEGRKTRKPLPRGLWVVSLVIAAACVIALAIGLAQSWNVKAQPRHSSRSIP